MIIYLALAKAATGITLLNGIKFVKDVFSEHEGAKLFRSALLLFTIIINICQHT